MPDPWPTFVPLVPFDEDSFVDNQQNNLKHPAWDNRDNWKVNRKSRVKITNPAALLTNQPAGLTVCVDYRNNQIKLIDGRRVVGCWSIDEVKRLAGGQTDCPTDPPTNNQPRE